MSQPTIYVPIAFARPVSSHSSVALPGQDPKSTSDTPSGAPGAAPNNPAGGQGSTTVPGGTQPAQTESPCGGNGIMWMMPLFLVLMYFMMIRPEQKRRKEQTALLASIKQGDKVVTASGMHGVVSRLTEKTVTLRVDTVEMTFDRSAVGRIERNEAGATSGGSSS